MKKKPVGIRRGKLFTKKRQNHIKEFNLIPKMHKYIFATLLNAKSFANATESQQRSSLSFFVSESIRSLLCWLSPPASAHYLLPVYTGIDAMYISAIIRIHLSFVPLCAPSLSLLSVQSLLLPIVKGWRAN